MNKISTYNPSTFKFILTPTYSYLKIDNDDIDLDIKLEKEKDMFTIYYDDIKESYEILINKISKFHFDLMVSYFIPRKDYMRFMNDLLCKDGEIMFQYYDRNWSKLIYNQDKDQYTYFSLSLIGIIETDKTIEEKYQIKIDNINKKIFTLDGFFNNRIDLSPQIGIHIKDENNEIYENNVKEEYLIFLNKEYPNYNIELKCYTYQKYEYVLPLNIFSGDLPTLYFYIENIMEIDIKEKYKIDGIFPYSLPLENIILTDDQINKYMKIINDNCLFNNYIENSIIVTKYYRTIDTFNTDLIKDLTRKNFYYKLIKNE
jgi:hypothetical protein